MLRSGLILIAVSLTVSSAVAQAQAPAGGGNNNGAQQQQQQPSAEQRQRQQQQEQMERQRQEEQERRRQQQVGNMFVSGNVLLASGGAPAEPVRIQYACRTQRSETLSDSKGRFTVFVQPQGHDYQDTWLGGGVWSGAGDCTLRAVAPGYRSNTISGGGTIILTPVGDAEGSIISATSLTAPKKAKALLFKAMKELGEGPAANLNKAMEDLQRAVDEYPEYAAAWARLGQVKAESGDPDGAIAALEKSVELDKRYVFPYDALVRLYMGKEDWDHATELTKFVLGINPADAAMRWYQAVCSYETGHDDEAMSLIGEIVKDPEAAKQFPQTQRIMGLIYAKRGEFAEAAAAFKRYLEWDPDGPAAAAVKKQLNEWEKLGVIQDVP